MTDIFAQDIALDETMQARVAGNGESILTDDPATGVQDVILRLDTYLGTLFYDKEFGSLLRDWIYAGNDELARIGFAAKTKRLINGDPILTLELALYVQTWWQPRLTPMKSQRAYQRGESIPLLLRPSNIVQYNS